jgi:Kef-type K+ transport system membrane component KefB
LAAALADKIGSLIEAAFLPVFFVLTGLQTEVGLVTHAGLWGIFFVLLAVAVVGKLGGSAGAARAMGVPWSESLALGVLMNTRGLMELVILNVGLEIAVISRELFTMMVLVAVITTLMTSPLLAVVLRTD